MTAYLTDDALEKGWSRIDVDESGLILECKTSKKKDIDVDYIIWINPGMQNFEKQKQNKTKTKIWQRVQTPQ